MAINPCQHEWMHVGSGPTVLIVDFGRLDWCWLCGAIRDGANVVRDPLSVFTHAADCAFVVRFLHGVRAVSTRTFGKYTPG